MIEGVIVTPLKQFFDERGKVMHMLHDEAPHFKRFGLQVISHDFYSLIFF